MKSKNELPAKFLAEFITTTQEEIALHQAEARQALRTLRRQINDTLDRLNKFLPEPIQAVELKEAQWLLSLAQQAIAKAEAASLRERANQAEMDKLTEA